MANPSLKWYSGSIIPGSSIFLYPKTLHRIIIHSLLSAFINPLDHVKQDLIGHGVGAEVIYQTKL